MELKSYIKQTEIASFQGKDIIVENWVPDLSPGQREKRKREIENQLYDVFHKYRHKSGEKP